MPGVKVAHHAGSRPPGLPPQRILLSMTAGPDGATVAADLADRGWTVTVATDGASAVAHAATDDYALLLSYGALPVLDGTALAARIARLPAPRGSLPLCVATPGMPLPSDDAMHGAVLAAPRSGVAPPDPVARFTPLFGAAAVAALLTRFRDRLAALLAADDPYAIGEGATVNVLAHRIAGIAGTLDFALLAAAWRRVEQDGPAHLADAWLETRIGRSTLDILLERVAGQDAPPRV